MSFVSKCTLTFLSLVMLSGCSESLFSEHESSKQYKDDVPSCEGDCFGSLATQLTSCSTGPWKTVSDSRARTYTDLKENSENKFICGTKNVSVNLCRDDSTDAGCETPNSVVMKSSSEGAAAIEYFSKSGTTIKISGEVKNITMSGPQELWVYRNSREDLLKRIPISDLGTVLEFEVEAELLPDDRVFLVADRLDDVTGELALNATIEQRNEPFPDKCLLGVSFNDFDPTLGTKDFCGQNDYVLTKDYVAIDGSPITMESTTDVSLENLGKAIGLRWDESTGDGYFEPADSRILDYSGDFTIQMWLRVAETGPDFSYFFGNRKGSAVGEDPGLSLAYSKSLTNFHALPGGDLNASFALRSDPLDSAFNGWHFVRFVRDANNNSASLCIDGQSPKTASLEGTLDLTRSVSNVNIGGSDDVANDGFHGDIDDVRVIRRALPCQ